MPPFIPIYYNYITARMKNKGHHLLKKVSLFVLIFEKIYAKIYSR